jgi:hypothetical protein
MTFLDAYFWMKDKDGLVPSCTPVALLLRDMLTGCMVSEQRTNGKHPNSTIASCCEITRAAIALFKSFLANLRVSASVPVSSS